MVPVEIPDVLSNRLSTAKPAKDLKDLQGLSVYNKEGAVERARKGTLNGGCGRTVFQIRMRLSFAVSGVRLYVAIQPIHDSLVRLYHPDNGNDWIPDTRPALFETIDFSMQVVTPQTMGV